MTGGSSISAYYIACLDQGPDRGDESSRRIRCSDCGGKSVFQQHLSIGQYPLPGIATGGKLGGREGKKGRRTF
jgi:hypothetical protein